MRANKQQKDIFRKESARHAETLIRESCVALRNVNKFDRILRNWESMFPDPTSVFEQRQQVLKSRWGFSFQQRHQTSAFVCTQRKKLLWSVVANLFALRLIGNWSAGVTGGWVKILREDIQEHCQTSSFILMSSNSKRGPGLSACVCVCVL